MVESPCGPVNVPGRRQRRILTALLLQPNSPVSTDRLIEVLWGSAPPRTAREQVQNCASSLIHFLRPLGDDVQIERINGSYAISLGRARLDAEVFRDAIDRSFELATRGNENEAKVLLAEALGLWRGDPLADVLTAGLAAEAARLEELRMSAIERYVELALRTADYNAAIVELTAAVARYPFNERLREQLMRALHETGRSADALCVFQEVRRLLVRELGLEPGAGLQRIQQEVLTGSAHSHDPVAMGDRVAGRRRVGARAQRPQRPSAAACPVKLVSDALRVLEAALSVLAPADHDGACLTCTPD